MARKYTHFSYTHLTTVYNIIIHVSLVITLILCSVQSMFISPWQNSNHQWFLWWVFLMNIYCSWVAQLFLYMIPGQKKKEHHSLDFTMCDVCVEIAEGDNERRRDFLLKLWVIWNIISAGLQFTNSLLFFQFLKQLLVTDWSTVDLQCLRYTVIQFYIYIFFIIRFFH